MHFEYQRQVLESNADISSAAVDLDLVAARNRGGGVPCSGRNGLVFGPPSSAPLGSTDHQHQMRMLVLRERLRRALYN
ncbi:GH24847 [Drosophila grimshawi]|uniref:GH24847 n=1 Tax=Drosophila grimshawi TaxID=7222 RepID=B4JNM1_DROGR|nr:GH24847 [Drosophila grimshawi]